MIYHTGTNRPGDVSTSLLCQGRHIDGLDQMDTKTEHHEVGKQKPLPIGWVQKMDDAMNRPFYVSARLLYQIRYTQAPQIDTTAKPPRPTWVHPYEDEKYLSEHPEVGKQRPLPFGWIQKMDAAKNRPFYVSARLLYQIQYTQVPQIDATAKPPRATWVHPYEDEKYLSMHASFPAPISYTVEELTANRSLLVRDAMILSSWVSLKRTHS